jgi:hypothetical protein
MVGEIRLRPEPNRAWEPRDWPVRDPNQGRGRRPYRLGSGGMIRNYNHLRCREIFFDPDP